MGFMSIVNGAKMVVIRNLPKICMISGGALAVGTVVASNVGTKKAVPVIENYKEEIGKLKEEGAEKGAIRKSYISAAWDLTKIYAPAAAMGIGSAFLISKGYLLRSKEVMAISAAYVSLDRRFKSYRERVKEEIGEEKEELIYNGLRKETRVFLNEETGQTEEKDIYAKTMDSISIYARFFDETNVNWDQDNGYNNYVFLKQQEMAANRKLKSQGHLFLNEVYDMLGLPRSVEGQYVGWVDGAGDSYISFGVFMKHNKLAVNDGFTEAVLLDFNVDGPIMYIIENMFQYEYDGRLEDLNERIKKCNYWSEETEK